MSRLVPDTYLIAGKGTIPGLQNILAISSEFIFALQELRFVPDNAQEILFSLIKALISESYADADPLIAMIPTWQADEALITRFWLTARDPDDRPGSWIVSARAAGLEKTHRFTKQFAEDWRTPLDLFELSLAQLALRQDINKQRKKMVVKHHRIKAGELP